MLTLLRSLLHSRRWGNLRWVNRGSGFACSWVNNRSIYRLLNRCSTTFWGHYFPNWCSCRRLWVKMLSWEGDLYVECAWHHSQCSIFYWRQNTKTSIPSRQLCKVIITGWLCAFKIVVSSTECPRVGGQLHCHYLAEVSEARFSSIRSCHRQHDIILLFHKSILHGVHLKKLHANFHGQSTGSESPDVNIVLDDYLATEGYPIRSVSLCNKVSTWYTVFSLTFLRTACLNEPRPIQSTFHMSALAAVITLFLLVRQR